MLSRRIAGRYAEALFGLAQQQNTAEAWDRELATLASVLDSMPELTAVLTHPEIPLARKQAIVERAFGGKIAPQVLAVLLMLIRRGHEPDIATIHDIYRQLWDRARRVMPVSVASAVPLTEVQAGTLAQVLARRTGATIQLSRNVDPELIAGMVITMGDRVIDASARGTLEELRTSLATV